MASIKRAKIRRKSAHSGTLGWDLRRNVLKRRAEASPVGSVWEQGGTVKGEWAGSAPFSPSVLESLHQITGIRFLRRAWRCTCEDLAHVLRYLGFTRWTKCVNNPVLAVSTHSLINNNEEGSAEFFGSKEPVSFRHQYQNQGHGWVPYTAYTLWWECVFTLTFTFTDLCTRCCHEQC